MRETAPALAEEEFATIVKTHHEMALNVAYSFFGNMSDAEDAVQETFIKAYRNFASFKGNAKVSTWLYRITINECITLMRKRKRQEKTREAYTNQFAMTSLVDHEGDMKRKAVEDALQKTPPAYRAAIILKDIEGKTLEEIGEILGLSAPAVSSRLFRGRKIMKDFLMQNKEFTYEV